MLCRKLIGQALIGKSTLKTNAHLNSLINSRHFSRRCILLDSLLAAVVKPERSFSMSSFRLVFKDLNVRRLWSAWSRSFLANTVIKRFKRDRSVREVIQCFRQAVLRPRRTLLLSTAAFKFNEEEDSSQPPSCGQSITDNELEALVTELESVEELFQSTLFCIGCGRRIIIDKKLTGVRYCACKEAQLPDESYDGWLPYMEAEDVIIWRKEYKPGQGLYAYKVYGRYSEVLASDFAAVQVDGAYRRVWDAAVATLSVVERHAQGIVDQAVLHWEVLWPRLFANRDYVYIRRHKDFEARSPAPKWTSNRAGLFEAPPPATPVLQSDERPNVHSHAKRKAMEKELREKDRERVYENKIFVIMSRSCEHPDVPESKSAIRVSEYWSHMVVKSLYGVDKPGMEFVLTYYDEPAVGGLPSGVAAWATGRAAPAYLDRMRRAAMEYAKWRDVQKNQDLPDFISFSQPKERPCSNIQVREQDMESSKDGPELENAEDRTPETSSQNEVENSTPQKDAIQNEQCVDKKEEPVTEVHTATVKQETKSPAPKEGDSDKQEEEDSNTGCWWRNEEDHMFSTL
ncbi:unnamed protein product [Chilo suppressalis]|uniref:START domain-containing protein n=1 Tax=Chilo suppressalis TaxID=168631 RepID=A0ABN8B406_CHISP|nr:unnamed protein product [Chilo suppressalis]